VSKGSDEEWGVRLGGIRSVWNIEWLFVVLCSTLLFC